MWVGILLVIGLIGAIVGLPPSAALFFYGKVRVRAGALKAAHMGIALLVVSVIGLVVCAVLKP